MGPFLIFLLKAAGTWAAQQILTKLTNSVQGMQGSDLASFYKRLLTDMRGVVGEAIAQNEIDRCAAEVKAITWTLNEILGRYSSPAPVDILTILRLQKSKATELLYQNERFFVKTFHAYYFLTILLTAVYGELAKLDPKHASLYKTDAIKRLFATQEIFAKQGGTILQKKAALLLRITPLHMDERPIDEWIDDPDPVFRPGLLSETELPGDTVNILRLRRVGTEYRHYFNFHDADGRVINWSGGWTKDRGASHHAGATQLSATVWSSKHIAQLRDELNRLQKGLADTVFVLNTNKSFGGVMTVAIPKVVPITISKTGISSSTELVTEMLGNISILPPLEAKVEAKPKDTSLADNPNGFHAHSGDKTDVAADGVTEEKPKEREPDGRETAAVNGTT